MARALARKKSVKVEPVDQFAEGSVLGPYRVQRFLGAGTFGVVYLVKRGGLGKRKALKLLKQIWLGDEKILARFQREAHALAELHDENLTQVEELGVIDGRHFIEMEYLEGRSLAKALEEKPRWSLEEALDVVLPVASGLHVAHTSAKRLVHRDLKPDNIFLQESGGARPVPKVIDFGVAHASGEGEGMTEEGQQVGTRVYMSPEQVNGEPDIDGRADQWALAILLFVMLTGRRPFHVKNKAQMTDRLITEGATPALRDDGITIPVQAEEAMRRALRKERHERYATMREFGLALAPYARRETRVRFEARWSSERDAAEESTLARPAAKPLPRLETAPTQQAPARADIAEAVTTPRTVSPAPDEPRRTVTQPIERAPRPPVEFEAVAAIERTAEMVPAEPTDLLSDAAVERGSPRGERARALSWAVMAAAAVGMLAAVVAVAWPRDVGKVAVQREAGALVRDAAATRPEVDAAARVAVAADASAAVEDARPSVMARADAGSEAAVRHGGLAMRDAAVGLAVAAGRDASRTDAAARAHQVATAAPIVMDASPGLQASAVPSPTTAPDAAQGEVALVLPVARVVRIEEGPGGRVRPRLRAPSTSAESSASGINAGGP